MARGLGTQVVELLDAISCRGLVPDLTILLDIDPATSVARTSARNAATATTETRLDEESREFHTRVREGYLALASANPHRVVVVDGSRAPQEIANTIFEAVLPRLLLGPMTHREAKS